MINAARIECSLRNCYRLMWPPVLIIVGFVMYTDYLVDNSDSIYVNSSQVMLMLLLLPLPLWFDSVGLSQEDAHCTV